MMAAHVNTQLQYYRHDYAKVCMTGLLGCRWHRYKQSTKGSRKRDVLWFVICLLVSLYVIFWFYFWLTAANDRYSLNEGLFRLTGNRFDWFTFALVMFSILFAYVVLLMILSMCHIVQGHQLYIHPVHLVIMMFLLVACIVVTITVEELWHEQWSVILISLQVFGPFLHIGAVVLLTLLSWMFACKWYKIRKIEMKLISMFVYFVLMLSLYVSPLFINSPCVILEKDLSPRPKIFAHRGAASIAPENTVIAFEIAAQYGAFGIETDVKINLDGELFLMHDATLQRTTNIAQVYPDLVNQDVDCFNSSQLDALSAGDWFIEVDPTGNVENLSEEQKSIYRNQKIPTFIKVLELCVRHNLSVMFDMREPDLHHPYYNNTFKILSDVISMSGINKSKVYFPAGSYQRFTPPLEWNTLYPDYWESVEFLKHNNYSGVHGEHQSINTGFIQTYKKNNILTSVYQVNKAWLFSFYWCAGFDLVTTDFIDIISKVDRPVWQLSPTSYLILWVVIDCISAVVIIVMFLFQRHRLYGDRYHPERLSLSSYSNGSGTWGPKRTRRSMKEKLLMKDVQTDHFDFEPEDDHGIDSTGYTATITETEGREISQAFHSNRNSYHSNMAKDNDQNENAQAFNSNRNSYHSNQLSVHDNNEANRSSFISSVENGELFGESCNINSYRSTENHTEDEHTDFFPNDTQT